MRGVDRTDMLILSTHTECSGATDICQLFATLTSKLENQLVRPKVKLQQKARLPLPEENRRNSNAVSVPPVLIFSQLPTVRFDTHRFSMKGIIIFRSRQLVKYPI